jgi:hypothetical protein
MTGIGAEQADLPRRLQELAERYWAGQQEAAEHYSDLLQRLAAGELDANQLRDDYARFASEESARYAGELAQLSLSYYSALLELGRAYSQRFFDAVLEGGAVAAPARNGQAARAEPRQVLLEMRGIAGQDAAAGFVIENKRDAPADITFRLSDFADAAGGRPFAAPLQVQPQWLSLGPEEEAEVRLRLPLLPELFTPGRQYRGKVVVQGYDELELILSVSVDSAPEPATRVSAVVTPAAARPPEPAAEPPPAAAKKRAAKRAPRKSTKTARPRKPRRTNGDEPPGAA